MTEQIPSSHPQEQPQIYEVDPALADRLYEMDPREAEALIHGIGTVALGENAIGLVVDKDTEGNEQVVRFISLNPKDLGTAVNLEKNDNAGKYPTLQEAHDQLKAAREPKTEEAETFDVSQLQASLGEYRQLVEKIQDGALSEARAINDVSAVVTSLANKLALAESEGSWAGNNLSEHEPLIADIRQTASELAGLAARPRYRMESGEDAGQRVAGFSEKFDDAIEVPFGESAQGRQVKRIAGDVSPELHRLSDRLKAADEDEYQEISTLVSTLDELAGERHLTVGDAERMVSGMVERLKTMWERVVAMPGLFKSTDELLGQLQKALDT